MSGVVLRLRPAHERDASAVSSICLRTGDAGHDASPLHRDPELLGLVWALPYLALAPEHATVLVGDDDLPQGYVVGVPDSRAFEARCERDWWPDLRVRYPLGAEVGTVDDSAAVALIHHPPRADAAVVGDHPGHLHIDLLPAAQGGGHGRLLVEHCLASLRAVGCPGAHVGVDPRNGAAAQFYRRLGFTDLGGDPAVVLLGIRLDGS